MRLTVAALLLVATPALAADFNISPFTLSLLRQASEHFHHTLTVLVTARI